MWIVRSDLPRLKGWIEAQGYKILEPIGDYEVMRWQGEPCEPMPIIYRSEKSRLLTVGVGAQKTVRRFLKHREVTK